MSTGLAVRPQTEVMIPQPMTFDEMRHRAEIVAASGLFKMTTQQVLTLMMICECKGKHPLEALEIYYVYDGKAELKTQFMQARFEAAGGSIVWHEISNTSVSATFIHPRTCPQGAKVTYTLEDAKDAGLLGKANWKNKTSMLSWRATKLGVNRAHAACIFGFDVPEVEEEPEETEKAARASLVDKLAARRESPKELHPPVTTTVAEIKQHEAAQKPAEPTTEWGEMVSRVLLDFNKALGELADANPGNLKLRNTIKPQQAINAILNDYIERGIIDEAAIKNGNGKRDGNKTAAMMSRLWDEDSEDVEATLGRYLGAKMSELMPPQRESVEAELAGV